MKRLFGLAEGMGEKRGGGGSFNLSLSSTPGTHQVIAADIISNWHGVWRIKKKKKRLLLLTSGLQYEFKD